jgi:hypothetical protein
VRNSDKLSPVKRKTNAGTEARIRFTPYWTTFELPTIDMKAASVGILDQIVA